MIFFCLRVYFCKIRSLIIEVLRIKIFLNWAKNVPLSEVQRAQIAALHKEGYSERSISEKMKCSKSAVHNAVVKFKNTGCYSTRKKFGRPRKTTPRDDAIIHKIAVHSPLSSADKIRSVLL